MFKNAPFLTRPLYLQVRDYFVQRIVLGEWKPEMHLPNENLLSQELGVSVGTVRKALEQMEQERIVSRRQGRGTFVNDQATSEMSVRFSSIKDRDGRRIEGTLVAKSIDRGPATAQEADRLNLHAHQTVLRVERVHHYHGHPFMVEVSVLREDLFPSLPDDLGTYRICILAQANTIYLSGAEEQVTIQPCSASDATILDVAPNLPVLRLDRTINSVDGKVVEWRVARCYLREKIYSATIV